MFGYFKKEPEESGHQPKRGRYGMFCRTAVSAQDGRGHSVDIILSGTPAKLDNSCLCSLNTSFCVNPIPNLGRLTSRVAKIGLGVRKQWQYAWREQGVGRAAINREAWRMD